ncbi:MAG: HAMP domain-containing protein [Acidobacteria bacterium]|nr:HAMP domain-containing protein [Acidobacteriota bacterium]MBI3421854.1 HAMP domain-containing protein [Acidobacteriota bacterium]
MENLKLYTRTTLLTSAVMTAVLVVVAFFFITKARAIERQEQEQRAELWATVLANQIAINPSKKTLELHSRVISFGQEHERQIRQIRIYSATGREVVSLVADEPETLAQNDLNSLHRGASLARPKENEAAGEPLIYAAAPIFNEDRFEGVVTLTARRDQFSSLARRLITLTLALLALALLSITALLYFLFSQVLYRPVESLLSAMTEARTGRLEAVAPVHAHDEFGQLAVSFNHLLAQLRAMTAEREAYQKQLEERVHDATTELAERNTQLEEANAALFEIQRELTKFERLAAAGQMAAQFAHEVGTPLNLISGHVQLLAARKGDAKTAERLELIGSQIARIERIVRNMLDATRRPQPQFEALDLNALLTRIFEITAPTLAAHQVELQTELAETLPFVQADNEQLQQVFINLINNALDAMPQGGELCFRTAVVDDFALVSCRDSGEGIRAEIKARVFDPLFTTKLRGLGTGLGLAVAQQIVREHGGEITVESELGQGAEFQLRLPLAGIENLATHEAQEHGVQPLGCLGALPRAEQANA